jgi:hypothetical protein
MKRQQNSDKLEIMIRNNLLVAFTVAVAALATTQPAWASGVDTSDPSLPPNIGAYSTPGQIFATYNGPGLQIVFQNALLQPFAATTVRTIFGGVNEREQFNASLNGLLSVNGSPFALLNIAGLESTLAYGKSGNFTGTFNTEMVALDLSGATVFGPLMIRESPTLASLGQTTITSIGGGMYHVDSFFDVFTELSVDGGQTWIPQSGNPTHLQLVPEPGTLGLSLVFGTLAALWRRK